MPARPGLALVDPPPILWRVERLDPPLRFSHIALADTILDRTGNRFDVAGAGVIYASTDSEGAYAETLAGFRISAELVQIFEANGQWPTDPAPGTIPATWRSARRLRAVSLPTALPFVDVDAPATHTHLALTAPHLLTSRGVSILDVAAVRGPSRRLTRDLATWLFMQTSSDGTPLYSGIRYGSRLGPYECSAVFEGTEICLVEDRTIDPADAALNEIARVFSLTLEVQKEQTELTDRR